MPYAALTLYRTGLKIELRIFGRCLRPTYLVPTLLYIPTSGAMNNTIDFVVRGVASWRPRASDNDPYYRLPWKLYDIQALLERQFFYKTI